MITVARMWIEPTRRLSWASRRTQWLAVVGGLDDSERDVGAVEEVELPVMAGALDVGSLPEVVVVAPDLREVMAVVSRFSSWDPHVI